MLQIGDLQVWQSGKYDLDNPFPPQKFNIVQKQKSNTNLPFSLFFAIIKGIMASTTTPASARAAALRARRALGAIDDDTKAQVIETKTTTYVSDKPESSGKDRENDTEIQSTNGIPRVSFPQFFTGGFGSSAKNTIENLASLLVDDGQESYVAVITRLADLFNDSFFFPCATQQAFPPMAFNASGMLLNFVPQLTRFNNNSGGRFNIQVCSPSGEPIDDAILTNFVIANPPRAKSESNGNGEMNVLIDFIREQNQQNQQFQAQLLQQLAQLQNPKNDRFTELAEQVLMKKLSEETKSSNPQDVLMQMLVMPEMVSTFAEQFRNAMGVNKPQESSTFIKLVESPFGEQLGARAGEILAGLTQAAANFAQAKALAASQPQVVNVPQSVTPEINPVLPPSIEPPKTTPDQVNDDENDDEKDELKMLVEDIIAELETENPINDDNQFVQELKTDYPMEAELLKMLCERHSFEELLQMLAQKTPEVFQNFLDPRTMRPTERGVRLTARLKEFYDFYKEPVKPAKEKAEPKAINKKP